MKPPQPCVVCADGTMTYREKTQIVEYGDKSTEIAVPAYWCDSCDEGIIEKEGHRVLDAAYRSLRALNKSD